MNSEECRNGKGDGGCDHHLQADDIEEYARRREHDDFGYVHRVHRFGASRSSVSLLTPLFVSHADSEYTPPNGEPRLMRGLMGSLQNCADEQTRDEACPRE